MRYSSWQAFEKAVLGCHSSGGLGYKPYSSFTRELSKAISGLGRDYPDTRIGKFLYFGVKGRLEGLGIDTRGFKLGSSVGTYVDKQHKTDAFFFLPSIPDYPVTIDLFNMESKDLKILEDLWSASAKGEYTELDYQSDLYLYKCGLTALFKVQPDLSGWKNIFAIKDLRFYSNQWRTRVTGRYENHFILTPEYANIRKERKKFIKLVADCFVKASSRKTALLSHQSPAR